MLSKWNPWDYARNHSHFMPESARLCAYYCFDPFVEKVLYARFLASKAEGAPHAVLGSEITPEWVEENILGSDLFGEPASYRVLHAEGLPAKTRKFLLENTIIPEKGHLILSFSSDDKFLSEFSKKQEGHFFKIPSVPFWFNDKLLDFFADGMGMRLPWDVKQYLLGCVEAEGGEFVGALKQIALAMPVSDITLEKVRDVIGVKRLDQFALAETFCKKDFTGFYQFFLKENHFESLGFDSLRMFFSFMQGHLLKISDPRYIDSKPKPSQYDRSIQAYSKTWQLAELRKFVGVFAQYEMEAKMKSDFLIDRMRRDYLSHL
tara:strand:- start:3241 stop:4197 length:957 start_codon:yes stop_codon:yes gene_type:complete